ncbi:hypothetical protein FHP25_33245 [Vineibacter terrae]|uniref:Uncharacterized protein n=1 Tax=Vineibacter terrae TaxID=2586908 RepID=A0A5C8PBL6_9HYPH|nr:hypothetical protein [Vineibacter terrae]TXL70748.1 hypothetical protein FHP25_33245 [Vineibacter terrae]
MSSDWKQIEIDIEVYKALEAARISFEETHNDILHRVLKITPSGRTESIAAPIISPREIAWSRNGVELPEGTRWRLVTTGAERSGHVTAGYFDYQGTKFGSPSGLAMSLYRTKTGKTTNLNGWRYIEVSRPGEADWILLQDLLRIAKGQR